MHAPIVGACVIAKLLMVPSPAALRSACSWVDDASALGDNAVTSCAAAVASALRCRVSPHGLQRFGVVSGLIVVICGAAVLGSLIWEQGL